MRGGTPQHGTKRIQRIIDRYKKALVEKGEEKQEINQEMQALNDAAGVHEELTTEQANQWRTARNKSQITYVVLEEEIKKVDAAIQRLEDKLQLLERQLRKNEGRD